MKAETGKKARDEKRRSSVYGTPDRWKVVATVQPQGDAGVRWVQLTYARERPPEDWPYRRAT